MNDCSESESSASSGSEGEELYGMSIQNSEIPDQIVRVSKVIGQDTISDIGSLCNI